MSCPPAAFHRRVKSEMEAGFGPGTPVWGVVISSDVLTAVPTLPLNLRIRKKKCVASLFAAWTIGLSL